MERVSRGDEIEVGSMAIHASLKSYNTLVFSETVGSVLEERRY